MKIIRGLLIILLTLFWVFISFVGYLEEKSILTVGVVTFIYCLLLYIVWPLGKPNSYISIQRLFIGLGFGMLLMVIEILFRSDCPIFPTYTIIVARNPRAGCYF